MDLLITVYNYFIDLPVSSFLLLIALIFMSRAIRNAEKELREIYVYGDYSFSGAKWASKKQKKRKKSKNQKTKKPHVVNPGENEMLVSSGRYWKMKAFSLESTALIVGILAGIVGIIIGVIQIGAFFGLWPEKL